MLTLEAEAGGSATGQPGLPSEFQDSQDSNTHPPASPTFSTEVIGLVSTETEACKTQTFYIACGIEDVEAGGLLQSGSQHGLHIETRPPPNKIESKQKVWGSPLLPHDFQLTYIISKFNLQSLLKVGG